MRGALFLMIALSGCLGLGDATVDDHAEAAARKTTGFDDSVTMTISHQSITEGHCLGGHWGDACAWISMGVDNTGNDADLAIGGLHWSAVASDGGVYDDVMVDGADDIAAGARGTFRLGYDLPEGVRIQQVRFGAFDVVLYTASTT